MLSFLFKRRRRLPLAAFDPAPLNFEPADELLLDAVARSVGSPGQAAEAFAASTPGELHAAIERHLSLVPEEEPAPDAAAELRDALAQLRQSIG